MAVTIRPADHADLPAVIACVEVAFGPYVARIGKPPAPMLADYAALIGAGRVYVLTDADFLTGVLVLEAQPDCLFVDVLAIRPDRRGRNFGRSLMQFAESVAQGKGLDTVALYTHERMVEALSFYDALGYVETDRRVEHGYARVYLRKTTLAR